MHRISFLNAITMLVLNSTVNGQNKAPLVSNNSTLSKAWQCSGLTFFNESLFIPAEKCNTILVCTKDFNDFRTIQLDFKKIGIDPSSVEIEAITIYKNELWFTDESTSNHRLYSYNLNSRQLDTIYSGPYLDEDTTSFGMEGITVDSIKKICYVLKEKNHKNQSVIRVFEILELENRVHLKFIRNIYIELPDIRWRYSDLHFNANDNYLYCLKTRKGKYKIDTIYTSNLYDRGDIIIPLKKNNEFKDISKTINSYGKTGYDTNMEGLVMTTEAIYVVSDNAQTKNLNCATQGQKKTLLIKIPIK